MTRKFAVPVLVSLSVLTPVSMAQRVNAEKPQPEICATYLGVRKCVVTREPRCREVQPPVNDRMRDSMSESLSDPKARSTASPFTKANAG